MSTPTNKHCDMDHKDIHQRIDGLQTSHDLLAEEIKGLRKDITPMIEVFKSIQVYIKGGKFMTTIIKSSFVVVASIIGLTWTSIQVINYFTK